VHLLAVYAIKHISNIKQCSDALPAGTVQLKGMQIHCDSV